MTLKSVKQPVLTVVRHSIYVSDRYCQVYNITSPTIVHSDVAMTKLHSIKIGSESQSMRFE